MQRRNDIQRGMAAAWYLDRLVVDWSKPGSRRLAAECLEQQMEVSRATGYRLAATYAHFHGLDNPPAPRAKAPRTRQERRAGFPPHGPVV